MTTHIGAPINAALILEHWDDLLHLAASITTHSKIISSNHFNLSAVTVVAFIFVLITIPRRESSTACWSVISIDCGEGEALPILQISNVSKSYGTLRIFDGLSLDVEEHEVVCLIGASGCGKSTLLRCINGLEPIASGEILIHGNRVSGPGVDVTHCGVMWVSSSRVTISFRT